MKNPPAFPVTFQHRECTSEHEGMDLRDYFAAKALQGMITEGSFPIVGSCEGGKPAAARHAYEFADAMLAERAKGQ